MQNSNKGIFLDFYSQPWKKGKWFVSGISFISLRSQIDWKLKYIRCTPGGGFYFEEYIRPLGRKPFRRINQETKETKDRIIFPYPPNVFPFFGSFPNLKIKFGRGHFSLVSLRIPGELFKFSGIFLRIFSTFRILWQVFLNFGYFSTKIKWGSFLFLFLSRHLNFRFNFLIRKKKHGMHSENIPRHIWVHQSFCPSLPPFGEPSRQ